MNYKLVFQNQSIEEAKIYKLVRETKTFVFLQEIKNDSNILRVSKKTLKVRAFNKNKFSFEMPTPIQLIEV